MTGFLLSPGITPALVSAVSVELPLSLGLAYVFFRSRGLEAAIGLNAVALAAIKIYTDYADPIDLIIAVAVLAAGLVWLALSLRPPRPTSRLARGGLETVGIIAIALGVLKVVSDFYDPFDTFVACLGVVAGTLLLRWGISGPSWFHPGDRVGAN